MKELVVSPGVRIVRASVVMISLVALVVCVVPVCADDYVGFADTDLVWGFWSVDADIQFVPTTVGSRVTVWCGIDDGCMPGTWMQVGWRKLAGAGDFVKYYEFRTDTGYWLQPWIGSPPSSAHYSVFRGTDLVYFEVAGIIEGTYQWSWFSARPLIQAYYGAELKNAQVDFVPGSSSYPCYLSNITLQTPISSIFDAALLHPHDGANSGKSKSGNTMWIWDTRN